METKVSPLKFVKNLFLAVLGLHGCPGFSSCGEWGSYCLVAEPWLQGSWASGIALHRLSPSSFPASRAQTGSVVVADRLSCSAASGIFPDKRIEPEFPALAGGFFTTEPPGKPPVFSLERSFFPRAPAAVREWPGGLPGVAHGVDVWGAHCIPGMLVPSGSSHSRASSVWEKRGLRDGTYFWSTGRVQVELLKEVLPIIMPHLFSLTVFGFTFYLFIFLIIYLFVFGCAGSLMLLELLSSFCSRAQSIGLIAVVPRSTCCVAFGLLRDQGLNLYTPALEAGSLPGSHQGSLLSFYF